MPLSSDEYWRSLAGGGGAVSSGGLPIQSSETASQRPVGNIGGFLTGLNQLNADPLANPMFQRTIQSILASLAPSETSARRNLGDIFRRTGQTQSGAFAEQSRMLEGDILGKRGEVTARHAGDIYSRLLSGQDLTLQGLLAQGQDTARNRFSTYDPMASSGGGGGGGSSGSGGFPSHDVAAMHARPLPYGVGSPFGSMENYGPNARPQNPYASGQAPQPYVNPYLTPGYFDQQQQLFGGGGLSGSRGSTSGFGIGEGGIYNQFSNAGGFSGFNMNAPVIPWDANEY